MFENLIASVLPSLPIRVTQVGSSMVGFAYTRNTDTYYIGAFFLVALYCVGLEQVCIATGSLAHVDM
jgi:hypothetical protein